ncbi:MAG: glycosyltransferase [Candidatus Thorarchaeota archaeon]|jgi:glycosyltransferase involved in cell wall biosynthesis
MRILHLWNVACVGHSLTKYQNRLGHEALLVDCIRTPVRRILYSGLDEPFYKKVVRIKDMFEFLITRAANYDIIHLHSQDAFLDRIIKSCPKKPIILTYHGTDIRHRWAEKEPQHQLADLVTVATEDLLKGASKEVIHIPNPVDTELFRREVDYFPGAALHVWQRTKSEIAFRKAKEEASKRNLILRVQERNETVFPYITYPRILELFEYIIDIKESRGQIIPAFSLTGLQSLALGSKVIHMGQVHKAFPEKHNPLKIAETWIKLYEELL